MYEHMQRMLIVETWMNITFNRDVNSDVNRCIWDVNRVEVRYWDSSFMGHTTGNDLLEHFTNITEPMNYSSIIHLSMDWPSVNHKFYRDLKEYRERKNCLRWLTLEVVIFIFYMEHLNLDLKVQIGNWKQRLHLCYKQKTKFPQTMVRRQICHR